MRFWIYSPSPLYLIIHSRHFQRCCFVFLGISTKCAIALARAVIDVTHIALTVWRIYSGRVVSFTSSELFSVPFGKLWRDSYEYPILSRCRVWRLSLPRLACVPLPPLCVIRNIGGETRDLWSCNWSFVCGRELRYLLNKRRLALFISGIVDWEWIKERTCSFVSERWNFGFSMKNIVDLVLFRFILYNVSMIECIHYVKDRYWLNSVRHSTADNRQTKNSLLRTYYFYVSNA